MAASLALGIGIYVAAAVFLVTPEAKLLYQTTDMWRLKLARLEAPGRPPHLIIVSASNGLYSIDSPTLAATIGRPVTNAAMQGNFTMPMLEAVAEQVQPGDWVFLPLEWGFWTASVRTPMESCYVIANSRGNLNGVTDWAKALINCNPKILLMGVRQRLTRMIGMDFEPSGMESLISPEGDILENLQSTATAGSRVRKAADTNVTAETTVKPLDLPRIEAAVRTIRLRGGTVIVSWPAHAQVMPGYHITFQADIGPDHPLIVAVRDWANRNGAVVVSDPRAHAFPLDCLWDNGHHLHRGCSPENARRYGKAIKEWADKAE